jgi:ribosomal protein S18 acetylase RimI-like enzyme
MEIIIARAGMEAVPETDALIREAADWLTAKGEPLWRANETSYDKLVRVAKAGELVTGRIKDQLAACLYLHGEDNLFWPQALPGEAFYIHRLAVARKYAGRGCARAMLDWAARETSAQHRPYLRLDCEPRPKLLALYRDAGFTRIDERPIQVSEHFVVRHEMRVLPART